MVPSEGEMEGKVTERLTLGAKFSGMTLDGSRPALLSEEMSVELAMFVA
jgi:hypothetical protein